MRIRHLRHATALLTVKGVNLLLDPMLSRRGAMEPVAPAPRQERIPLVDLPLHDGQLRRLVKGLDGVLLTHLHRDHWDARAREILPRNLPVFCQPEDEAALRQAGFSSAVPVAERQEWRGISLFRTGGRHGTGEIGKKMGKVSGFVVKAGGEPSLYIAGDTVWCPEVKAALATHRPDAVVVYSGAAAFSTGGPITMNAEDVADLCRQAPAAAVLAIHLEAVNHCLLTRAGLRERLEREGLIPQVRIPRDGETLSL